MTYSSINTNSFDGYGEQAKGTMIVSQEKILLYKEAGSPALSRSTSVSVDVATKCTAGPTAAAALGGRAMAELLRGYREELEHFAYCVSPRQSVEPPR